MKAVKTNRSRAIKYKPESAFLSSFDQAIEFTARRLMDSGMTEDQVWEALILSVETLRLGIDSISSNQFTCNYGLKTPEEIAELEHRALRS